MVIGADDEIDRWGRGQLKVKLENLERIPWNQTGRSRWLLMWPRLVTTAGSRSFRPIFGAGNPGISPAGGMQSICSGSFQRPPGVINPR